MKVGEDNEWKDVQKKDTNNRPSETCRTKDMRVKKWIPVHQILITGCY